MLIVSRMLWVLNIQKWYLIYIYIFFYYVGKICTDITPTNSRAKWEDYIKAWNYIKIYLLRLSKGNARVEIPASFFFHSVANRS